MTDKATARIVDQETRFWQSMIDKDAETAAAMIADACIVTGPMGAVKIDPERYAQMTRDGKWTLKTFELSDVDVIFPADDVAVIAYTVHQTGEMADQPMDLTCADSTTWVLDGQDWKCASHTETILDRAPNS